MCNKFTQTPLSLCICINSQNISSDSVWKLFDIMGLRVVHLASSDAQEMEKYCRCPKRQNVAIAAPKKVRSANVLKVYMRGF